MRILAIDYGTKNMGLAVSDPSLTIATELEIVSVVQFWKHISDIVARYEVDTILVGLPVGLSGQETQGTKNARAFIAKLKKQLTGQVTVYTTDERMTTDLAKRFRVGLGHHDALVAQILLQEYLDGKAKIFPA